MSSSQREKNLRKKQYKDLIEDGVDIGESLQTTQIFNFTKWLNSPGKIFRWHSRHSRSDGHIQ